MNYIEHLSCLFCISGSTKMGTSRADKYTRQLSYQETHLFARNGSEGGLDQIKE